MKPPIPDPHDGHNLDAERLAARMDAWVRPRLWWILPLCFAAGYAESFIRRHLIGGLYG